MAIEKMQAEIIAQVNDQSFVKAWQEAWLYARDIKKELDKNTLFKLQLDKANTKIELENARALLRQAKKDWDKELTLRYTIKTDELQSKLTEAWRRLNNFKNTGEQSVSRLSVLFNKLWVDVWALSNKFAGLAIWAGFLAIWKQALLLWDKLEQANISFETMLWSSERAKNLLSDLATFASNTPFELIWLRDTAKQLLAFGIDSEQIIPTLKALWDVSAWLSVPIEQVAYAYWQVRVAWRLMWWELMQFTNAWVPLIAELAKNLWVAESEIKKMVSSWQIGFKDVEKAFQTMSWEWWKFNDLMAKQATTLSWKWSNLKDRIDLMSESLWWKLLPIAKKIIDILWSIIDITIEYSRQIWFLIVALATLIWARWLLWLYTLIGQLIPAMKTLTIVQWLLTGSINLSTISMRAFTVAALPMLTMLWAITWALWWATQAYKAYSAALELIDATNAMQSSQDAMFKVMDEWTQKRKNAINELKQQNEELLKSDDVNAKKQIDINNKKIEANKKFLNSNLELSKMWNTTMSEEERLKLNKEWVALMKEAQKEQEKLWGIIWKTTNKSLNDMNGELDTMKDKLWNLWVWTDEFYAMQEQIKNTEEQIKKFTDTWVSWAWKIKDAEKDLAKTKEDLLKQELEQRKKFEKYQEDLQKKQEEKEKKRQEKIEKANDLIKDYYNTIADTLEKSQDKIDDFNEKIDETSKKIKDLQDELKWEWVDIWVTLEEKRIELIEKRIELEEKYWRQNLQSFTSTDDNTLRQIWSWTLSWWASWNDILEYKKILEELAIIEQNNVLITDEAKKIASESESERLIREYNEKKAKIEQEIADEQAKLAEFTRLKEEEKAIYDQIDQYRTTLEQNFTALLQGETLKRINELEKIRQKAIETANALAKAGVTYNTTNENNVNVNLQGTWYTSVDAYNVSKVLTDNINLSSKWINK